MDSEFDIRILQMADLEAVKSFGERLLKSSVTDPMEYEIQSWTARWREEALRHYLPLGWSFGAFQKNGLLIGVSLAQPMLFFRGFTQSLWVEYFTYKHVEAGRQLVETVYRWGRDKHIQLVIFEDGETLTNLKLPLKGELTSAGWYQIPTTRMKT